MQRSTAVVGGVVAALVIGALLVWTGVWVQFLAPADYERTTVTVADANGTELGTVDVRIADGWQQQIVGLSRTDSLADGEGMLFTYEEERGHTFVMRDMSFPLDIVFVAENGTITTVHHASVPQDGANEGGLTEYTGVGQYVLEVDRGWTNETGVGVGDRVVIPNRTAADVGTGSNDESTTAGGTATATPTLEGPTVTAVDANGTELGTVAVTIANNSSARYTGLSDTESLDWNEGMLFVFPEPGQHAFVMRRMSFPLDIIYAAENGTVTRIHHAPTPPEGETYSERYPGEGKYVLEVNRGWANATGLDVGDRLQMPNVSAT